MAARINGERVERVELKDVSVRPGGPAECSEPEDFWVWLNRMWERGQVRGGDWTRRWVREARNRAASMEGEGDGRGEIRTARQLRDRVAADRRELIFGDGGVFVDDGLLNAAESLSNDADNTCREVSEEFVNNAQTTEHH